MLIHIRHSFHLKNNKREMDFKITAVLLFNCLVTCTAQSTTATYRNVSSPCIKFDYKCDPETGLCSQVLAVTAESLTACNCTNFDEEVSLLKAQLEELSEGGCKVTDDQKTTTVATTVSGPYRDCDELLQSDPTMVSGVYEVTPENYHTILVYCDVDGDEAWTVIQRRLDDTVYFGRPWSHYRHGFGPIDGTHWLGNEQIHYLTEQGRYKLHIDMVDVSDEHHVAKYDKFHVDNESTNYRLKVGYYHGTAGDSFKRAHNKREFSTINRDNDQSITSNCAELYQGGWWYGNCADCNLNGPYHGMFWKTLGGIGNRLQKVTMKIQRKKRRSFLDDEKAE